MSATVADIRQAALDGETLQETADRFEISLRRARELRKLAGLGGKSGQLNPNLVDGIDDTTPGCARCGLRGAHECLKGDALDRRER